MKDNTNSKFLQLLYGSTYIPMHYFHHEKLIATFPSGVFLPDQLHYYLNYNESTTKNVDSYSVEDYLYIGIVKNNVTHYNVGKGIHNFTNEKHCRNSSSRNAYLVSVKVSKLSY